MAGVLKIFFGKKFPDTRKYETQQDQLRNEYARFLELGNSSLYQRFLELDTQVHSGDFKQRVYDLKHKKFKDTPEYQKLKRFKSLTNNKEIKVYMKFYRSGKAQKMEAIQNSEPYKRFEELKGIINTPEFYKEKSSPDFKKKEAYKQFREYKKLQKDNSIKWFLKTEKSQAYKIYKKLDGSEILSEYYELKALVESPEFKEYKSFMEDRRRFQKSDEAALLKEYAILKKDKDIVWYLRKKEEKPFEELKKWKLTFEDQFSGTSLDQKKWITAYYWGKALMNDSYSLEGEKQYYSPANIEVRDSVLRIITRKEEIEGKVWNPQWGFRKQKFKYTSGLISTGQSFRQKYGRFEAKVRFNKAYPFIHAFWMVGEKMVPHIDIFKTMYSGGRLLEAGIISDIERKTVKESTKRINGAQFTKDFFIYSLDWSENEMVWKINGVPVYRQTHNIPQEPMYLTFCTTLVEEPSESELPAIMEINWIRCYKRV